MTRRKAREGNDRRCVGGWPCGWRETSTGSDATQATAYGGLGQGVERLPVANLSPVPDLGDLVQLITYRIGVPFFVACFTIASCDNEIFHLWKLAKTSLILSRACSAYLRWRKQFPKPHASSSNFVSLHRKHPMYPLPRIRK